MTHRNAPLSIEGRRRLVERCQTRPIAHVAAGMGISRACASKWVNRYRAVGALGLYDRSSAPDRQPTATPIEVVAKIERLRRSRKWSAARIAFELSSTGTPISRRTVSRHLAHLGLNRRRFIDPSGSTNREPQRIIARRPGHMIHIRSWAGTRRRRLANARARQPGSQSRRTSKDMRLQRRVRLSTFRHRRVLSPRLHRSAAHQRITPYTPRHNGKVERYNRTLAEEFLYARTWTSEQQRAEVLAARNVHYIYHRPHRR
jgi:transposase